MLGYIVSQVGNSGSTVSFATGHATRYMMASAHLGDIVAVSIYSVCHDEG